MSRSDGLKHVALSVFIRTDRRILSVRFRLLAEKTIVAASMLSTSPSMTSGESRVHVV